MYVLYLITGVSLSVYVVAAWVAGRTLGLKDSEFYVLFGLLTAIGTLAAGAFVWWKMRSASTDEPEENDTVEATSDGEVDLLRLHHRPRGNGEREECRDALHGTSETKLCAGDQSKSLLPLRAGLVRSKSSTCSKPSSTSVAVS